MEKGYSCVTIRSVAAACSVGTGTVYNYFSSKDMLVASFMAEDWLECTESMKSVINRSNDTREVFLCIYDHLSQFILDHQVLFSDKGASAVFASVYTEKHGMLRGQLIELIAPLCASHAAVPSDFLPEFLAEAVLTWTTAGRSFTDIYSIIEQFFVKRR